MKKLLWVGDAGCPSGFAKATHEILEVLRHDYDVTVLAINYRGDPTGFPEFLRGRLWAAAPGGDTIGIGRLIWMCDMIRPNAIILQNDGWNIPQYIRQLRKKLPNGEYVFPDHAGIPVVAAVAVDGKHFQGRWLDGVAHAIFWTQFALDEAREGGYQGPASVIPLGVDLSVYRPMNRAEIRAQRQPEQLWNAFIVGNVNRNQPRKRWDLLVKYFATWITNTGIRDAYLFLHTAPTGDIGYDVKALAQYYGVVDRLARVTPEPYYGPSDQEMAETYNCFDVNASMTQGEGFGLTALESMACGVPQILPDWSALGDWARGAACLVPCSTTNIGPPYVNVIGGVADEEQFISALDRVYRDQIYRTRLASQALAHAHEKRFRWAVIGAQYIEVMRSVLGERSATEAEWQDLGRPEVTA